MNAILRSRWSAVAAAVVTIVLAAPVFAGAARAAPERVRPPVLVGINAAHVKGGDQLVFRFTGGLPGSRPVRYFTPGNSDHAVGVGNAYLIVTFTRVTRYDSNGVVKYGPRVRAYSLPGIVRVALAGSAGKTLTFVVALSHRYAFRKKIFRASRQIVIDVRTPGQASTAGVFFANGDSSSGAPSVVRVDRPVLPALSGAARARALRDPATTTALARSALQRLFAGPTLAENTGRGLFFVTSGATGWRDLRISDGVARLQLLGGCQATGSSVTLADEIVPTLKQFPLVRAVKIYDPAGQTEESAGRVDSIPLCLESVPVLPGAAVTGPVLVGLGAAAGLGVLVGLLLIALSIVAGLVRRPATISPAGYRDDWVKAHPVGPGEFEPDLAWPAYPLRQMRADLRRIEADRRARYRKLWNWPGNRALWVIFFPISVAALVCLLMAGLTEVAVLALFTAIMWACAIGARLVCAAATSVLRGFERGWRSVRHSEASCPRCYHVTPRPAYQCSRCLKLHRDVRPGRLGVVLRRCSCGALLPTMVLRAAWRLEAVCQRCGEPLRLGSAVLRDVRIPIFGDTSAGKTRFLYAALDTLSSAAKAGKTHFGFPDKDSEKAANIALDLIRSGQDTVKTSAELPTALTCQIGQGVGATLLHLFDAAGEIYRGGDMHDALSYLDHGHALVYVLDPFAIGAVRDLVAGQNSEVIKQAHAAAGDPETSYIEVVSRLRDSGVLAARQRLAVVISKADLIEAAGVELPRDSAAIAQWLADKGMHNLVLSARREFAEVRYFVVASLAFSEVKGGISAGAPLEWLLSKGAKPASAAASADDALTATGSQP
ncbi:MAG TPA: hypothetical protein VFI65_30870 [Streptosporangiaceae bacterium]|nr:hypothetical protein [Streptosporangiaceae bacterium]